MTIRQATRGDLQALADLNRTYMHEMFGSEWHGTREALERDLFLSPRVFLVVAERDGELVGFAAWQSTYDLAHCQHGGTLTDLFVRRSERGVGVAVFLLAQVAEDVLESGGSFLRGNTVEGPGQRLYGRLAKGRIITEFNLSSPRLDQLAEADNWKVVGKLLQQLKAEVE